ncbi:hypothetical protein [Phycicoccus flavus]|uniref:Secreted protein n=1 Tax=Phycicoccus flavus TaxID=2502783 RepID=A0A8T6R1J6_9MICO|nr:hypothetical protein [Phycicoccus flavus]NHA68309.1 hypothetical protein [Phycicoccus flavus]
MSHQIAAVRLAAAAAASALLVTAVAPAGSAKDLEVRSSGACSAGATWKLTAKADDGRVEVELEVDSGRRGQTWAWSLADNGVRVRSGSATTTAPSGSFTVERRIPDRAGSDTVTARATHAGQTCRARVVLPG